MHYLSINTASASLEVALTVGDKIYVKADSNYKKASEIAMVFVDELLTENNLQLADLDFIAVVIGPGSFTGIRIGVSMVRIFGQFAKIKLVSLDSLEILTYEALESKSEAKTIISLADASNGMIYVAVYEVNGEWLMENGEFLANREFKKNRNSQLKTILPPSVIKSSELSSFLSQIDKPHIIVAERNIAGVLGEQSMLAPTNIIIPTQNGMALSKASKSAFETRGSTPYNQLLPLYIRKSQAEENAI
ncbi:MAG: tRNA (adenosine(37)-N6)-threonylcarbamoyltransferase complex dimerization subunit type 1 TsaB [Firmicutes bacterium]|nr:tRNA (adenosine(37)-N6)-threonylcarbamoyltransferase complex dimerization subunit type 1 TsaB [Bacillota bacterium]